MIYYLSLGSNLGDKIANINKAIDFLRGVGDIQEVSSLYETEPVGMEPGASAKPTFPNLQAPTLFPLTIFPDWNTMFIMKIDIREITRSFAPRISHNYVRKYFHIDPETNINNDAFYASMI